METNNTIHKQNQYTYILFGEQAVRQLEETENIELLLEDDTLIFGSDYEVYRHEQGDSIAELLYKANDYYDYAIISKEEYETILNG